MKIAICDDDLIQIKYLFSVVRKWADINNTHSVIETYESAEAFLFGWSDDKSYDVLLLDIQMPGQNGMELAKTIRQSDEYLSIIFVTVFSDYMNEGYDVNALHYLMKPINEDKLFAVLDKAAIRASVPARSFILPAAGGSIRIPADDILYAEAFSHTIELHTSKQTYTIKTSMNELEKRLEDGFFRCHRSYIVNMKHVRRITRTAMVLDSLLEIPLSRKLYDKANQAFIRYC